MMTQSQSSLGMMRWRLLLSAVLAFRTVLTATPAF